MKQEPQRFEIHWQGLVIEARYCPDWIAGAFRDEYGYAMTKLEADSRNKRAGEQRMGFLSDFGEGRKSE